MVVLSQPAALDPLANLIKSCKPTTLFAGIPQVDLTHPEAKTHIVKAFEEYGFLKVVNHGVPLGLMTRLEDEAVNFFSRSQSDKDKAGPPDPFGYGSKRIGPNGDVGWIEYLLLNANPQLSSQKNLAIFQHNSQAFRDAVDEYIVAVKKMTCKVMEMMADGLNIKPRNMVSELLRDEESDSCFRLNHYPPCPEQHLLQALGGRNLVGFGEHTDPQIVSVLRSNNTSGLQIQLKDATWVTVPPDDSSFFLNVGDALQVMTNGRFKSVKHRVLADTQKSRVSMIYFGGPRMSEKIAPIPCLLGNEEESLYREFSWSEYKSSAYRSRLADYRLGLFEKTSAQATRASLEY